MTAIVGISAVLSVPSTTRLLADRLASAVADAVGDVGFTHLELPCVAVSTKTA